MVQQKYLYVTPFFPSPGNWRGTYCLDAVKALMRDGRYDVVVFKPGEDGDYDYQGVKVWTFKTWHLPSAIFPLMFKRWNRRGFLAALERAGVNCKDVAVCHGHTAPFGIYPLAVKERNQKCLTLLHHHDLQSFGLNNGCLRHCWLYNMIEFPILRCLHKKIDCHVFISEMVKRSFERAPRANWTDYVEYRKQMRGLPYRPARIKQAVICNNGVDTTVFKDCGRKEHKEFVIGCIANFVALKGQMTLLKAVLQSEIPNSKVVMVGSGPLRKVCEEFAVTHGMNVEFRDEVPHERLADYYRSVDLFVLPSCFEGFGCVYTESWACGTPFITTSGAGVVELIPPEDRHLWVSKPHDVDDLAEKIVYYYQHRDRQRLVDEIDIETLTARFLDKIDRLRRTK